MGSAALKLRRFWSNCYTIEGIVKNRKQGSNRHGGNKPWSVRFRKLRANTKNAYDSSGDSASGCAGRNADLALQPKLGLLPEWRLGVGGSDSGHSVVDGQDLERPRADGPDAGSAERAHPV